MYSGAGPGDSDINIVAGLADTAVTAAALKRAHCPMEGQRGAVLGVAFMPTQPLGYQNDGPKKDDCCVNQACEHEPKTRQM